ncbi:glutaminase A [uncultured Ilyobacter sp.]|uniref:glutaminase A n=1 Tax=uncultured Ilyobacter sp. TaxID=544433 RepID=UPI0029C04769|nr:glutaminase A [uncultured Ilyobacter sp.]
MQELLSNLVEKYKEYSINGKVADYIPGLSLADPSTLGIAVCCKDGECYSSGAGKELFTIQSISKVITLMLAIRDNGEDYVFSKIGMEPTGDAFNSIQKLETCKTHKPFNPLINAGAIAVSSLIKGESSERKFKRILDFIRKISENPDLSYDEEIYLGEKRTGNRNRSMAYFMKNEGIIEGDVEEALDVYFKQCSIKVSALDLAKIGLFLVNDGIIKSGEKVVSTHTAKIVKSLMITCGMYDGSGEFAVRVGIPSKSGVGGGILSVAPGKMGIGIYGPALDEKGNSIAGIALLEALSKEMLLSIF